MICKSPIIPINNANPVSSRLTYDIMLIPWIHNYCSLEKWDGTHDVLFLCEYEL
jgi:hypothetical protein